MTPERWQRVKQIFNSALKYEPEQRAAFLSNACADDDSLRREVETLISSHERDGSFIDSPAYELAATFIADQSGLAKNQTFGSYEILGTLGRGGMGEVYIGQDKRLGRKVALKILPGYFSEQSERRRRFEQEARAASALNHPNILTIHEIGSVDGKHFIATELVEGETLRQRLSNGALKVQDALDIAIQVASALKAAHAAGIIHRDIKPENIMVRFDGIVKVLDFGLAKLTEQPSFEGPEATTQALLKTESGVVMGTAQYMSPEQARGLAIDARTDIWSFGCVLYELVLGSPPFAGETTSHTIVSILEKEPNWDNWPNIDVTVELQWIVRKALRKNPDERYRTSNDLLLDLKNLKQRVDFSAQLNRGSTPSDYQSERATLISSGEKATNSSVSKLTAEQKKTTRRAIGLAGVTLVALGVLFGGYEILTWRKGLSDKNLQSSQPITSTLKTTQITSGAGLDLYPALSLDGNSLAYSSDHGAGYEIYVRQLTPGGRELQLTSDGTQNFQAVWSPDGKLIAYHSKNRGGIWVVPSLGGVGKQLTDFGSSPAWSSDGHTLAFQSSGISDDLFAIGSGALLTTTIWTVPSHGGTPKQITKMGEPAGGHGSPAWSPDGKRLVFACYDPANTDIWTITSNGEQLKRVTRGFDPVFAPDGKQLYFVSFGSTNLNFGISRVNISPDTGEAIGQPIEIASAGPARPKKLTISADGSRVAYTPLTVTSNLYSIGMTSRTSESTDSPIALTHDTSYRNSSPVISPDGKRIAYHVVRIGAKADLWLIDIDGKNPTQLTTDPAADQRPSWFPDGEQIAYQSDRNGKKLLLSINLKTGRETVLFDAAQDVTFPRLSPDGKRIVFNSKQGGATNLWEVLIDGGMVKQLTFDKEAMGFPTWSPDGQYLAFEVKRGDSTRVGIMPSNGGEVLQLTSNQGQSWPHSWSPDGDKIAFAGFRNGYWNVWWVSRSTKTEKQLTNYKKLNAFVRYPAWSPAGDRMVYEYTETAGNIWLMELR